MFSSFELKNRFLMDFHIVILFLGLFVGLLLAYRYKLKDRSDSKDEEKPKKDKPKSKKIFRSFSKDKDKQIVNGVRNRKNELNETQDDKMGLLESKESPALRTRYDKEERVSVDICNGSATLLERQNSSSLERQFTSDEIKPNIDLTVRRDSSSLKILHDSIGAKPLPTSEDIKTNDDDHDKVSLKSNISHLSQSITNSSVQNEAKSETDAFYVNRTNIEKSSQDDCTKHNYEPLIDNDNGLNSKVKLVDDSAIKKDIKPKTSVIKDTNIIANKISTYEEDATISNEPKVDIKLSVKPKPIINHSHGKPRKVDLDYSSKTNSSSVIIKSEKTFPLTRTKIRSPQFENNINKDVSNEIEREFELDLTKEIIDSTVEEKSTINSENKALNAYANTSSTFIVNSAVHNSEENSPTELDEHIDKCSIEKVYDSEYIDEPNSQNTSGNSQIVTELTLNKHKDINTVTNGEHSNDVSNIGGETEVDVTTIANSISSGILSNVVDDLKSHQQRLFSEKIQIERYSNKLADVIINNNLQHGAFDDCDAGPPKTVTLPISNTCEETASTDIDSDRKIENQSDSIVMSIDSTGNFQISTGKHEGGERSALKKDLPSISLNDSNDDHICSKKSNENHLILNGTKDKDIPDKVNSNLGSSLENDKKPVVVLRKKRSFRKKKSSDHRDEKSKSRPVSGYAEQLAELLADDDDLEFIIDSDEELPDALEKIKETFQDKPQINSEIGKIQHKYSRAELREYGVRKLKSKVKSKIDDKKSKLKGDRPLSLYEQDLFSDLLNEEEFDDLNEVAEASIESVQSSVQILEHKIPFLRDKRSFSNVSSASNDEYDSLDESTKSSSDTKSTIPNGKAPGIGRAAVIDLGSGILKAGMAGEMEPSCYCPSVIGTPRRFSQDVSKMKKGYYVGDEAWAVAGMLSIDYPLKQDVTNWQDVTKMIEHLLDVELKVNDRAHPVMLTEKGLISSKHREKLTEIVFETFGVPAFYLANQASLALYSMGITTGICLNAGFTCTQSVPVYEGHCIPHGTVQLDIGGDHVTKHLGRILSSTQGHAFNTSSEKLVLNTMKQSLCYVSLDTQDEEESYKCTANMLKSYTLPDGQEIELNTERFQAPEILFNPQVLGLNKPNTAEIIQQSIDQMDRELVPILKDNIVVSGGTSKFSGYGPRLKKELAYITGNEHEFNIKYTENPLLATWIGGAVLSSISSFRDQWITIDDYAEYGSRIVHKVCI